MSQQNIPLELIEKKMAELNEGNTQQPLVASPSPLPKPQFTLLAQVAQRNAQRLLSPVRKEIPWEKGVVYLQSDSLDELENLVAEGLHREYKLQGGISAITQHIPGSFGQPILFTLFTQLMIHERKVAQIMSRKAKEEKK